VDNDTILLLELSAHGTIAVRRLVAVMGAPNPEPFKMTIRIIN
jgi:hypothetical protein